MMHSKEIPQFWVIIPAAGTGQRMKANKPKQYLMLGNKTILEHTINCFIEHPQLKGLIICLAEHDGYWPTLQIQHPLIHQTLGGKERAHTVLAGLESLQNKANANDWILVHDAARPNLQRADLDRLLTSVKDDPIGGILATPAKDTLKQIDQNGRIQSTLDRSSIWQALTPQMFHYQSLLQALRLAISQHHTITDEASAMELSGFFPRLIEGRADNIKVTNPEDIQQLAPYFNP